MNIIVAAVLIAGSITIVTSSAMGAMLCTTSVSDRMTTGSISASNVQAETWLSIHGFKLKTMDKPRRMQMPITKNAAFIKGEPIL